MRTISVKTRCLASWDTFPVFGILRAAESYNRQESATQKSKQDTSLDFVSAALKIKKYIESCNLHCSDIIVRVFFIITGIY